MRACMTCTERYPGCHDHCAVYQEERKLLHEAKTRERKELVIDNAIISAKTRIYWKMKKGHRR